MGFVDIPGAVATQVVAGEDEVFIRDTANRVVIFAIDSTGTGTTEIQTGATGVLLQNTGFSTTAVDQSALIDAGQHLLVSQNNAGGTTTFVDSGRLAVDVQGFPIVL
jgi:hypothetical protein